MSPEHPPRSRDFDFLLGSWTVEHRRLRHRLVGSTDWELFAGTAVCQSVLDGIGNIDEITLPTLGAVGMTVRLYNLTTENWTLHWASSRTGAFEPPVVGGFHGDVGRFNGDDVHDGQPIRVRYLWDDITTTTARWQQGFSTDGEQTWETNWRMDFTRRPPHGPA